MSVFVLKITEKKPKTTFLLSFFHLTVSTKNKPCLNINGLSDLKVPFFFLGATNFKTTLFLSTSTDFNAFFFKEYPQRVPMTLLILSTTTYIVDILVLEKLLSMTVALNSATHFKPLCTKVLGLTYG